MLPYAPQMLVNGVDSNSFDYGQVALETDMQIFVETLRCNTIAVGNTAVLFERSLRMESDTKKTGDFPPHT